MIVQTNRFGAVEADETRMIHFGRGILGFPKYKNYVLIQPQSESAFYWLQSVESPELAFVVTDPVAFLPDYQVPLREETRVELNMCDLSEANVLVIVNKVGDNLTANLQGPLVIHAQTRKAAQIVISEKKFATRHPIVQLRQRAAAPIPVPIPVPVGAGYVSRSA